MHTLLLRLQYKTDKAKELSKLGESGAEDDVKELFQALGVPNLCQWGKIGLELGDRLVSVQWRIKRTSVSPFSAS